MNCFRSIHYAYINCVLLHIERIMLFFLSVISESLYVLCNFSSLNLRYIQSIVSNMPCLLKMHLLFQCWKELSQVNAIPCGYLCDSFLLSYFCSYALKSISYSGEVWVLLMLTIGLLFPWSSFHICSILSLPFYAYNFNIFVLLIG